MKFFIIIIGIVSLSWFYVWSRLVKSSKLPTPWFWSLTGILFLTWLLQILIPLFFRFLAREDRPAPGFLFNLTYWCLGLVALLLVSTLLRDVIYGLWRVISDDAGDPQRRLFMTRLFNLVTVTVATGGALVGTKTALGGPKIKRVEVPIKDLHPDLDGLTMAQISDMHIGHLVEKHRVQHIVDMINSLNVDLLMFTGDFADGFAAQLREESEPLAGAKARLGKFYVTGNHEYYWNVDEWTARAKELGFEYLYNEHRVLNVKGAKILVGGVADLMAKQNQPGHYSSPIDSMKGAPLTDFKVLLAHQPSSCFDAFKAGYDLQLSGHTHNGQFFPNNLIIKFFHPYVKGLNLHEGKMWVYVNVGTEFWGPPQRLGIPGEITHLTLKRT